MFLAVGAAFLFHAHAACAEALPEMVAATLSSHPAVDGAKARLHASTQMKEEQVSGYFPELSVSATGGRNYADNSTSRGLSVTRGAGYSWLWEGSVTARQMLFDGMETQNRVAAARAGEKAAALGLADLQGELALRAVQTYVGLSRARAGLEMLRGQEANIKNYLSRIEMMVNEGAADEAELQQARDVLAMLDNYKNDYEGQVQALEADFLELAGRMPEGELGAGSPRQDLMPETVEAAIALAKDTHPMLRSASYEAQAAQKSVAAEKGTLYPDINGEMSYLKTDRRDLIGGEAVDARAVLRMNWNFETGGGQLARIREKNQRRFEAQSRVQELERTVERDVRRAYAEYETAKAQVGIQERRVSLNSKLFETYKTKFEGARITLLQLMQSDNQLLIARLEKMNAENRVLLAQYGVLAAMGRLQEALTVPDSPVAVSQVKTQ